MQASDHPRFEFTLADLAQLGPAVQEFGSVAELIDAARRPRLVAPAGGPAATPPAPAWSPNQVERLFRARLISRREARAKLGIRGGLGWFSW